jgi:C-terminal processing protease CtpA/Prc
MKIRILPVIALACAAAAQESAPIQMEPMTVKTGPLAFIGIRCSASVGMFGLVSGNAHVKELVIMEVLSDSAGQRAGILPKDRILRIDGVPITNFTLNSLKAIGERQKGDTIEFVILSADSKAPRTVRVILGTRKGTPP